jgi:hypothetical protein
MSLLENAGLSSNSLAGLGLSGSDIASLSNGSLSQNQISNMIQSAGIDPARIILPGTDGAAINGFGKQQINLLMSSTFPWTVSLACAMLSIKHAASTTQFYP